MELILKDERFAVANVLFIYFIADIVYRSLSKKHPSPRSTNPIETPPQLTC